MECDEFYQFEYLPTEILIEIFRHLSFDDIRSAALTCRQWMTASEYEEYHRKLVLRFTKILLSDLLTPAKTFMKSFRSFPNVILEDVAMEDCRKFLTNIGHNGVTSLSFESQQLNSAEFCTIIEHLTNLKELKFNETSKILDDKKFLVDPYHVERIRANMANIKCLKISLSEPEILSVRRLCCLISELEELEIKFEFSSNPGDTTLIVNVLREIIKHHATTLKKLSLKHIVDTSDFLASITVFNGFYLSSLRCIDVTPWRSLLIFISTQNNLTELDLSNSEHITDANVRLLVKFSINLEILKLAKCVRLSDASLNAIAEKLKSLKVLDISYCDRMTSYAIKETILAKKDTKFLELYIAGLEIHPSCIIKLCKNLPNLTILDLSHCMGITNCTVQRIIIDLTRLKSLNLQGCKLISDYALTGINFDTNTEEGFSIKRLGHLQYLNLKGCKLITDVSFIKSIKLLELKILCLPNIAICASDIKMLAKNCPSIVSLDLSECQTMENVDKVMEAFKDFKRLRDFQFSQFHISFQSDK